MVEFNGLLYVMYSMIENGRYTQKIYFYDITTCKLEPVLLNDHVSYSNVIKLNNTLVFMMVSNGSLLYIFYRLEGDKLIKISAPDMDVANNKITISTNEQFLGWFFNANAHMYEYFIVDGIWDDKRFKEYVRKKNILKIYNLKEKKFELIYKYYDGLTSGNLSFFEYKNKTYLCFYDFWELNRSPKEKDNIKTIIYDLSSKRIVKKLSGYYRIFNFTKDIIIYDYNYYGAYQPKIGYLKI